MTDTDQTQAPPLTANAEELAGLARFERMLADFTLGHIEINCNRGYLGQTNGGIGATAIRDMFGERIWTPKP